MHKENGRLSVNVAGVVSEINEDTNHPYIIVDGEVIYIKHSAALLDTVKLGEYTKFECYQESGSFFATSVK
jgi:hypothetical protein